MTIEELRKAMTESCLSQIAVEGKKFTEKEKSIWCDGYYAGCLKAIEYATTLIDEKFKITSTSKGEENDK